MKKKYYYMAAILVASLAICSWLGYKEYQNSQTPVPEVTTKKPFEKIKEYQDNYVKDLIEKTKKTQQDSQKAQEEAKAVAG